MKRPLLYVVLVFSAGIAFSYLFNPPFIYALSLSALSVFSAASLSGRRTASHACLYLALFFFGAAYYTNSVILPPDHISRFQSTEPKKVFVKGTVADDPLVETGFYNTDRTVFLLRSEALSDGSDWEKVCGNAKVVSYSEPVGLKFGDEIMLDGVLSEPASLKNPGVFDYSKYLRLKGIYSSVRVGRHSPIKVTSPADISSVRGFAYRIRRWARDAIDSGFDKEDSGFLKSIIIGDRAELGEGIKEDFIRTGTVHVLAISGLNVAFVAAICMAVLGTLRIPRKLNLVLTAFLLVLYAFITGANPPIVRAVVMFVFLAAGYVMGRDSEALNTLSAAALVMLLYDPKTLLDPGFQLSFASVASMIVATPHIMKGFRLERIKTNRVMAKTAAFLASGMAISAAAWMGSFPLVARYFNIVSPVSFIANLFIVPLLSVVTAISFVFLAVQSFLPGLGRAVSFVLSSLDGILFKFNHVMASAPLAFFRVSAPPAYLCALFYMAALSALLPRKKYFVLAALVLLNAAVWQSVLSRPSDLGITFLDVGQGDSAFVRTPSGAGILIDGSSGGDEERFDVGRSVIAPYLWNRGVFGIDTLIITHFHEDHIGGLLYILDNFRVGCVIDNGAEPGGSRLYEKYREVIKRRKIRRLSVRRGDVIGPFDGTRFYVLNPGREGRIDDSNDNSLVLKMECGNFGVLFCGDITGSAVDSMLAYGPFLRSDVVKVPHHGGRLGDAATSGRFFKEISARAAVISVGRYNRYKAPAKDTIDAILSSGAHIYETKDTGAVSVSVGSAEGFKISCFGQKN